MPRISDARAGRPVEPAARMPAPTRRDLQRLDRVFLGQRQAVLEVVRLLGDLVGPVDELGLERVPPDSNRSPSRKSSGNGKDSFHVGVLEDPLAHVVRQVQARLVRNRFSKPVHDTHATGSCA